MKIHLKPVCDAKHIFERIVAQPGAVLRIGENMGNVIVEASNDHERLTVEVDTYDLAPFEAFVVDEGSVGLLLEWIGSEICQFVLDPRKPLAELHCKERAAVSFGITRGLGYFGKADLPAFSVESEVWRSWWHHLRHFGNEGEFGGCGLLIGKGMRIAEATDGFTISRMKVAVTDHDMSPNVRTQFPQDDVAMLLLTKGNGWMACNPAGNWSSGNYCWQPTPKPERWPATRNVWKQVDADEVCKVMLGANELEEALGWGRDCVVLVQAELGQVVLDFGLEIQIICPTIAPISETMRVRFSHERLKKALASMWAAPRIGLVFYGRSVPMRMFATCAPSTESLIKPQIEAP